MEKNSRINWMDGLKGFAILTVVFLHSHNGYDIAGTVNEQILKWITSFHMALFLACAGYFYKMPNTLLEIKTNFRKKTKTLFVPYIIWGIFIGYFVENIRLIVRNKGEININSVVIEFLTT